MFSVAFWTVFVAISVGFDVVVVVVVSCPKSINAVTYTVLRSTESFSNISL